MPARFTITEKWQDKWFRGLSVEAKLLFLFLCDNCDVAGFWEVDYEIAAFLTGIPQDEIQRVFKGLEKAYITNEKHLWMKNFLFYQGNLPYNPESPIGKGIDRKLRCHNSLSDKALKYLQQLALAKGIETLYKGFITPPSKGKGNSKGKGKGKKDENFEKFWQVYPRKKNKGQAEITWNKIAPDDELFEKIISAVNAQSAAGMLKSGDTYTPHASTWLNATGWENEIEKENNGQGSPKSDKTKIFPIPGKTCGKRGCSLPAVHKATSGNYDHYYCGEHMPESVKEKYTW